MYALSMRSWLAYLSILAFTALSQSCMPGKDKPGYEYMPDMAHSIAYEANYATYYSFNQFVDEATYYEMAQPRTPVKGAVSRNSEYYPYPNTEEGRQKAIDEIVMAPTPITQEALENGKKLYNIYCAICHGEKGNGEGYLVREDGGKYPAQPADFTLDKFVNSTNGLYYHTIKYGRNLMGSYADKLTVDERWDVIHYIRSLQAKAKGLEYSEKANTLNDWAIPLAEWKDNEKVQQ